jgi:hypothetical protein
MQLFSSSRLFSFAIAGSGLVALACSPIGTAPAKAQAAYGSYVGVGAAGGLTRGDDGSGRKVSGVVNGRYKFLDVPVSPSCRLFPTISRSIGRRMPMWASGRRFR